MAAQRHREGRLSASLLKGLAGVGLAGALALTATPALAQFGPPSCTRDDLQRAADSYVAAQNEGDPLKMHLGLWTQYTEQLETAGFGNGVIGSPHKVDFARPLLDTTQCQVFVEAIITDPAHPYVIGTILSVRGEDVGSIDSVVTDKGDWLFNAANTLKYSKAENWNEIPAAQRDSRATLMAAANAYLDLFNDKNVQVPWGTPCARLEGGMYTGKGAPGVATAQDSCSVGVPSGVPIVNRRYVVDEAKGAVAVLSSFGNNKLPDFHIFRIENGKLRYVHTITVCKTDNCGFKPGQLQSAEGNAAIAAAAKP